MSIQVFSAKLYVAKSELPIQVIVTQEPYQLCKFETTADQTPIPIQIAGALPIDVPLTFKVNEYSATLQLNSNEAVTNYKVNLIDGTVSEDPIKNGDEWCIAVKTKKVQPQMNHSISSIKECSLTAIETTQLKHKLLEVGKGTSQYHSSSSLRHSIPEVSFAQSQRFGKDTLIATEYNYNAPESFGATGKCTSMGYGNKYLNPVYVQRNAEQNPGPNSYFQTEPTYISKHRKTNWSQCDRFKQSTALPTPGPAQYDNHHKIGADKPNYTIGNKYKHIPTFQESVPAPVAYTVDINNKAIAPSRYRNITLGYGQKMDFTKSDKTPGPGAYEAASVFTRNSNQILTHGGLHKSILE